MEFLSFNELKAKLCDLYKRNVDNAEIARFIMENELQLFNIANGFCAGEYVNNSGKKAIRKIHKNIDYVEIFSSNELNSLMLGDLDRLRIDHCKSLYGKEIDCDGFVFLPKDIYERLIFRHPEKEALTFPSWLQDIKQYFDQSEIELGITRNSICVSKEAVEVILDKPLESNKEDFDDNTVLNGTCKVNRDARDKRGMARIVAKYLESQELGEYKAIDIANKVIDIMNSFKADQTQDPKYIKRWISCVLDENAKKAGVKKREKL